MYLQVWHQDSWESEEGMRHSSVKKFHCLDLETIKKWPLTRSSFDKQNGHELYFFNLKKKDV